MITGSELSTNVMITNNENTEQIFNLYFLGLEEIASVNESQFSLERRGKKSVKIFFNDINNEVDVHVGYLVIETSKLTKKIPIVLTVADINPFFAIQQKQLQNYINVYPGGKVGMDIKIFDLKSEETQNINLNYEIRNFDSEIIITDEQNLVTENFDVPVTKIVDVPGDTAKGDYAFIISIDKNGKSISAYYFEVTGRSSNSSGGIFGNIEYFSLIILVFVIGMFWLIFKFFSARDNLIIHLQKQQKVEVGYNVKAIREYRKELEKIKNISEKNAKLRQLGVKRKRVVERIKEKHEMQKEEIKKEIEMRRIQVREEGITESKKLREKYERQREEIIRFHEREKRKSLASHLDKQKERVQEEKIEAVKELKEKYEKQKEKQMGQEKKKKELEEKQRRELIIKKINGWKNQGYKMAELKTHIKGFPEERIRERVTEWKNQGYVLK